MAPSLNKIPAVSVDALGVDYGSFTALAGIGFSLDEGRFLAVVGPNGAGKSTLIKVLAGLLAPSSGTASIAGIPCGPAACGQFAYIPQLKTLDRTFPALAVELVVAGMRRRWPWRMTAREQQAAMEALAQAGVEDVAWRPVSMLSGGQLQRVYIARALVRSPSIVLLDEPATGVDAPGEAELYRLLREYQARHGATVVMVTHNWTVAREQASDVLLINRIQTGFGSPAEVLTPDRLAETYEQAGYAYPATAGVPP